MKNEDKTKLYGLTCFLFQLILLIGYINNPDGEAFLRIADLLYLPFFIIPLIVKLFFLPYINKNQHESFYKYGVLSSLALQILWVLFCVVCICLNGWFFIDTPTLICAISLVSLSNAYIIAGYYYMLILILIYAISLVSSISAYIIAGYYPPKEKDHITTYNFKRFATGLFYGFMPTYIFTIAIILVLTFGAIINLIPYFKK